MALRKINDSDESGVRAKVFNGIRKMNDLVSMTLGPSGKSVMIDRGVGDPLIVDDGRRVAENIKLDDPIEQSAVRVCYGVTRKTDEKVGDGTTTSMVLTHAIMREAQKHLPSGEGMNVGSKNTNFKTESLLDQTIQTSKRTIIEELRKMAKPIETEDELAKVAAISVGDEELGKLISSMYWKLGKDGHISLEFNLLSERMESDIVPGLRFSGGYAADWMITDSVRRISTLKDAHILITMRKDLTKADIEPVLMEVSKAGKDSIVIIAPRFTPALLKTAYATAIKSKFATLLVRAPSRTEEAFKDMAVFCGTTLYREGEDLTQVRRADLGYVREIEVTDDTCVLIEGKGNLEDIEQRIKEVKAEAELQKLPQLKQDRYERASALKGGVGVIRIGAPTDEERNFLKEKIQDAKWATKHAYREGIVPGAGQAFLKAAENLPEGDILKSALSAPYEKLKENAGGQFEPGNDIYDPVAVEIAALENACSAAGKLLRISGAIAYLPRPTVDEAMRGIVENNNGEEDYEAE